MPACITLAMLRATPEMNSSGIAPPTIRDTKPASSPGSKTSLTRATRRRRRPASCRCSPSRCAWSSSRDTRFAARQPGIEPVPLAQAIDKDIEMQLVLALQHDLPRLRVARDLAGIVLVGGERRQRRAQRWPVALLRRLERDLDQAGQACRARSCLPPFGDAALCRGSRRRGKNPVAPRYAGCASHRRCVIMVPVRPRRRST